MDSEDHSFRQPREHIQAALDSFSKRQRTALRRHFKGREGITALHHTVGTGHVQVYWHNHHYDDFYVSRHGAISDKTTHLVPKLMENHMENNFRPHDRVMHDYLKKHGLGKYKKTNKLAGPGGLYKNLVKSVKEGRDTSPYTAFSRAKAAMYSKPKVRSQFRYNVGTGDESGFGVIDGRTGATVKKHKDFDKAHDHASRLNQVKETADLSEVSKLLIHGDNTGKWKMHETMNENAEDDSVALHRTLKSQGFRAAGAIVSGGIIKRTKYRHPRLGEAHMKDGHVHFRGEKHHDPASLRAHIHSEILRGITRESDRKERDHYRNEEVMNETVGTREDVRPRRSFRTFVAEAAWPRPGAWDFKKGDRINHEIHGVGTVTNRSTHTPHAYHVKFDSEKKEHSSLIPSFGLKPLKKTAKQ